MEMTEILLFSLILSNDWHFVLNVQLIRQVSYKELEKNSSKNLQ